MGTEVLVFLKAIFLSVVLFKSVDFLSKKFPNALGDVLILLDFLLVVFIFILWTS